MLAKLTTSGSFSPTLEKSIALARLPHGVAVGSEVEVEIRDKRLKARSKEINWGHYRVALSLHDEIVTVVPDFDAEWCKSMMEEIMSTPPAWAPTLPIACEVAYGKSYGDAK